MASLGDLMVRVGATIDGFSDAMKSVVSQASDAADAVADKLESIGDVGQRLAVLGGILTAAISAPLEEIARHSLDVAGTFEQTRIAFQTLMGSSSAAKDKLSELIRFAQDTPFEIPQVLDGARKLMALGFAAKDIVPILRIVGDQAAAMGQGGVGMDRILMNLGKIEAQGKITGHELRNLGEDDIPALASIALARHESKPEAFKDVSAGKVDSEEAINAIMQGMQLRTGGLMASQMDSFKAQMSNLKDQITVTADAIGQALLPVGKVLVNWAQEAMSAVKELAQWFAQLPAPIQGAAMALAGLAALAGPALVAFGGFLMALPSMMSGLAILTKFAEGISLGGLVSSITGYISTVAALVSEYGVAATAGLVFSEGLTAVGAVFLGIPALIAAVVVALTALSVWVYTHWAGVKAFLAQVFDGLGEAWNATLGVVVNWLNAKLGGSAADLTRIWTEFKSDFIGIWDSISGVLHRAVDGFKHDLDDLIKLLEKIPGMQKVFSAGSAFTKANHDASERSEMSDIGKRLRVGADNTPFHLTDAYQAALEKHNTKLKEAVDLLAKFKKGYEDGIVSEKDFKQAEANVEFIRQDVPKRESKSTEGKTKLNRNALDGLSGEHAHEEAQVALQRAQIEHDYAMAKPGSADTLGISPEEQAQQEIAAAEKRKAALDKLADDEFKKALANIDQKLKLYKDDQAGHQKLIEAKTAAEDKYKAAVQKTTFDLETIKKQANERILQSDLKSIEDDLKEQQKAYEEQLKTLDLLVQAYDAAAQRKQKSAQFDAQQADKRLQFELETGDISKKQYLQLKQEQYEAAYAMETQALEEERDLIDKNFSEMLDKAQTPEQKRQVMADYQKRSEKLDSRQEGVEQKHTGQQQDTDIALQKDQLQKIGTVLQPFQTSFASALTGLIEGTKTFGQAWNGMVTGMLGSWTTSLSQMASKWVTHLAQKLALYLGHRLGLVAIHTTTNQATVASDTTTQAQSFAITLVGHIKKIALKLAELAVHIAVNVGKLASEIAYHLASWALSLVMHLKKVAMYAAQAAAGAYSAVAGIPIIGPVLAPIAAAASFVGVMAFGAITAESGAVLPDHNTVGFLHPQEMVLPRPISVGLQNLIASGGLSNAGSIMNQTQGGSMSSTALQVLRNTAAADTGDTHHNYHGPMHYHASPGESMTVDTFGKMFKTYVRQNNFKMP